MLIVKELDCVDFDRFQMHIIYSVTVCILPIIIFRYGNIFFPSFAPKTTRLTFVLKSSPSRYLSKKETETSHKQKTRIRREISN